MPERADTPIHRAGSAWLVLARDISDSVQVDTLPEVKVSLVFEMDTGLVLGLSVGATEEVAIGEALTMGFTEPAGGMPAGHPTELLCPPDLEAQVRKVLPSVAGVAGGGPPPPLVRAVEPPTEAEDIFDSFVGQMSGRTQPGDLPGPSNWGVLYGQALVFVRAAPWTRWHDSVVLQLKIHIGRSDKRFAAVVMGNAGIQHGLVLYPGTRVPAGLQAWKPGRPVPNPRGTLAVMLDPPAEVPADLRNRAIRYGWPPDADLVPIPLRLGREEAGDVDATESRLLAVALAAVTAHDARGPIGIGKDEHTTAGEVVLGDGETALYSIVHEPAEPLPPGPDLRAFEAGFDLVPDGAPVVLGHLPWESVELLRGKALIYRPFPTNAPKPSGAEVPLLAVLPEPKHGAATAAKVAELDPYGVVTTPTGDGKEVFVLVGGGGAEILMEVQDGTPGLADYHRRIRATKGLHVVMVADEGTSRGEGAVYGFFECHQPPPKAPTRTATPRKQNRKKPKRRT